MPRARKKVRMEVELEATPRDFVMARLAAGRAAAQASIEAIDEALNLFVDPDQDKKGKERKELVESALESMGCASRALESAEETIDQADMAEYEPWDEDEGEDDGDDEEEEADDDE